MSSNHVSRRDMNAADEIILQAGDFYELMTTNMVEDINRTVVARLGWTAFFFGYLCGAARKAAIDEPALVFAIFCTCAMLMGMSREVAPVLGNFCHNDVLSDDSPWYSAFICGRDAHDAWVEGSETQPLELLSAALAHVEGAVMREGKYTERAAAVLQ